MEIILYYIRDHLVGTHYFIYAFILLFLMFSIIGYLFKQKYAKYDIKLATSQSGKEKNNVANIKNEKATIVANSFKVDDSIKKEVIVNQPVKASEQVKVAPAKVEVSQTPKVNPTPIPNPVSEQPKQPVPMPNTQTQVKTTPVQAVNSPNLNSIIPEIK